MKNLIRFVSIVFALSMFAGCAAMQQDYQNRVCQYDGAFEQGVNAAQGGQEMNGENIAQQCPPQAQADVRRGYREGYMSIRNQPPPPQQAAPLIVIEDGRHHHDHDKPPRQCVSSFGQQICGYNCIQAYGKARCAQNPRHSCMEAYGQLYCGLNCHEEYGQVHCTDQE